VRELENAVERAVIIASGRRIEPEDLPESITRGIREERTRERGEREQAAREGRAFTLEISIPATVEEIERRAVEATLDYTGGDKTRAARALGIGRKTLYRKLRQYDGGTEEEGGKG
jgi:DNA-binding NtrC family response regulator